MGDDSEGSWGILGLRGSWGTSSASSRDWIRSLMPGVGGGVVDGWLGGVAGYSSGNTRIRPGPFEEAPQTPPDWNAAIAKTEAKCRTWHQEEEEEEEEEKEEEVGASKRIDGVIYDCGDRLCGVLWECAGGAVGFWTTVNLPFMYLAILFKSDFCSTHLESTTIHMWQH